MYSYTLDDQVDGGGDKSCSFTYDDIFISAVSEVLGVTATALIIDRYMCPVYFPMLCGSIQLYDFWKRTTGYSCSSYSSANTVPL